MAENLAEYVMREQRKESLSKLREGAKSMIRAGRKNGYTADEVRTMIWAELEERKDLRRTFLLHSLWVDEVYAEPEEDTP